MKILLIGANGALGHAVQDLLAERGHDLVTASRHSSDITVDISDSESVRAMFDRFENGAIDAVASAAGPVPWGPLEALTLRDVRGGLEGKVVSQIDLVLQGIGKVTVGGSFTLITGVLARTPIRAGAIASLANGALEAFVRAAALELPKNQRINAVSPTVFDESLELYGDLFAGFDSVPVRRAANAYVRSIEGGNTGQIYVVD